MQKPDLPEEKASLGKVQRRFERITGEMRESRSMHRERNRRSRLPNENFKRRAYELISHYVENDWHHVFALVLSKLSRIPKTSIQPNENPFFWGLTAACGDETIFSVNQVRRIAKGMQRAYELEVRPNRIISFLKDLPAS